ncbi:hypothetical protein K432DRAFT_259003, partial [Lepidopterella palustris CBS 459.81]
AGLEDKIAICKTIISYDFGDKLLCAKAFSTFPTGGAIQGAVYRLPRNDRMAVYGDAGTAASYTAIFNDNMLTSIGQWDTIRQAVLGISNLATVGFAHELLCSVILNPGTATTSYKTMATTMEAIVGAVCIDGSDGALGQVMESLNLAHSSL